MKNKRIVPIVIVLALLITGGVVFSVATRKKPESKPTTQDSQIVDDSLPQNTQVHVELTKSKQKDNAVVLTISKLNKGYKSIAFELTYDSNGIMKGVNSGSNPIDVSTQDTYEKEVYMGTCSKNVCKPDAGVKSVSVALEFTDSTGTKSQFTQDYPL